MPAAAVTVAITSVLSWGCAVAPSPSAPPTVTGSPELTASATTGLGVAAGPIPPLLLFTASGARHGLWRMDPNVRGFAPTRITTPDGAWRPTAPAVGGLVALTSVGEAPARVALTRLDGTALTRLWSTTLPNVDVWSGGQAECVSSAGTVAVGDGGLTLHAVDERGELTLVPGQRNNLGECTWLDATTLVWDQEDPQMRAWTIGAADSVPVSIRRFEPTAGDGRIAWFDDSTGSIRVAAFEVVAGQVLVGPTIRGLALPSEVHPARLALSADGHWLVGLVDDGQISIYPVSDTGFGKPTLIPFTDVGFDPEDEVTWMPAAP